MPPLVPALLAVVYRLLGPTLAAGFVIWLILIAFHGFMFGMLPWLGAELGLGSRPGLAAGLFFHVSPSLLPVALRLVGF